MTGTNVEGGRPRVYVLLQQAIQATDHARSALGRQASRGFVDQV